MCDGAKTSDRAGGGWVRERWVLSFAWPFDQGAVGTGKPEDPTDQIIEQHLAEDGLLGELVGGGDGDRDKWRPAGPKPDTRNLDRREWDALLDWLQLVGRDNGLTAHNAKFDIHQMYAGTRKWAGADLLPLVEWDTLLGADLWIKWMQSTDTGGRPTSSLKEIARWLWGEAEGDEQDVIKTWLRQNKMPPGRWDLMPWHVIARYADQDARLTARLRKWQEVEGDRVRQVGEEANKNRVDALERGWTAGYGGRNAKGTRTELGPGMHRRMEVMRMLTRVERRGVPFDTALAREGSRKLGERIAEAEATLGEVLKGKVTLDMAKHYWFGRGDRAGSDGRGDVRGLGLQAYALTDKGAPVVDVAVLSKMERDQVPLTAEWVAYKRLDDAKSRWYDGWADRAGSDGRLRTSFRQTGTASGRFSVEGIQLQAIPADYRVKGILEGIPSPRDLIAAGVPEGYELWEMDLAQAELRVAAYMAGCQKMLDAIARGADLHGETAKGLFHTDESSPDWGSMRQVAKRANFSLIFGVGWRTFQETLWKEAEIDMSEQDVRDIVQAWNALYPEYKQAIRSHEERVMRRYRKYGVGWMQDGNPGSVRERRWFTPWDVRHFDPQVGRMDEGAHKAFNQRVQPALAQYGQDLWLEAERRLRAEYGDGVAGLCLMVHDSMVLLLPVGHGERVTEELREMGRHLWAERFPGLPGDLDVMRWSEHA